MTTSQRYTKLQNKTVSKEGRKRIVLDKNDLTNIYRHNRSPKIQMVYNDYINKIKHNISILGWQARQKV